MGCIPCMITQFLMLLLGLVGVVGGGLAIAFRRKIAALIRRITRK